MYLFTCTFILQKDKNSNLTLQSVSYLCLIHRYGGYNTLKYHNIQCGETERCSKILKCSLSCSFTSISFLTKLKGVKISISTNMNIDKEFILDHSLNWMIKKKNHHQGRKAHEIPWGNS